MVRIRTQHTSPPAASGPLMASPALQLSARGRLRRFALLSGMGLSFAALISIPDQARAAGPAFGSPAWAASRGTAQSASGATPQALTGPVGTGEITTPNQALIRTQRSIADLARAADQINKAQVAQLSARNAAANVISTVPNGLTPGGLDIAVDAATGLARVQGATAPTQKIEGARSLVTVEQTAQKAVLTWNTFNIGQNTTLHFDQSAGTQTDGSNNWIALNRVNDPSGRASQILGQIKAEGSVYLINNNGLLFGAGSTVDTHSLLVSSLNLYSNDTAISNAAFLSTTSGIANNALVNQFPEVQGNQVLGDPGSAGKITIEGGATIHTGAQGYTLIAAPTLSNAGSINADDGQAILAAGRYINLGNEVVNGTRSNARLTPSRSLAQGVGAEPPALLSNTGIVQAARGNITLLGSTVQQNGVVDVTTSLVNPGSIVIDASVKASFGNGASDSTGTSLTSVRPDHNGETTSSSQSATDAFKRGSIAVSAPIITLNRNAQIEAPGGNVSLVANVPLATTDDGIAGRIYVDSGAIIDVAGLSNVQLARDGTLVAIPRIGQNELADSPVQRNGFLFAQTGVVIDSTASGTRSDGTPWVGSPILNAAGYVDGVLRNIDRLLVDAGSITLRGAEVITQRGSLLDLDGGYLTYLPGRSGGASRLQTTDGHLYDISRADPQSIYSNFAGSYVETQARFGISRTYLDPIISGRLTASDSGYIQGGKAGTLTINVTSGVGTRAGAVLLAGEVTAQALAGRSQVVSAMQPAGGTLSLSTDGALLVRKDEINLDEIFPDFDAATSLSDSPLAARSAQDSGNVLYWTPLSAPALNSAGFSTVALSTVFNGRLKIDAGADLAVQDRGSIALNTTRAEIDGNLTARAGSIAVTTSGTTTGILFQPAPSIDDSSFAAIATSDIVIGAGVHLDASGRFVNDSFLPADQQQGSRAIDGGKISLTTIATTGEQVTGVERVPGSGKRLTTETRDTTGNIVLAADSLLDVSSGGYVSPAGVLALSGGLPRGKGGDISLIVVPLTGMTQAVANTPAAQPQVARIEADGELSDHLLAYGFSGGGTLSLRALGIQIGGDPTQAEAREALYLRPDFFSNQGFSNYQISTPLDATIAAGTVINVSHANLLPDEVAILSAPTGTRFDTLTPANPNGTYASLGQLDAFRRTPTNFSLYAGDYVNGLYINADAFPRISGTTGTVLLDQGAAINTDAGASVTLHSVNQVTVLGSITAHGGNILLSGDSASAPNSGYLRQPDPLAASWSSLSKSVWLGADSTLDVSGVTVLDPLASQVNIGNGLTRQPRAGRVLDGGNITLSNDTGSVVALSGALLNVSGTAGSLELLEATGSPVPGQGYRYVSTEGNVYSDAGSITLGAAGGLLFDGSLSAHGGGAQAHGGSLVIAAESGGTSRTVVGGLNGTVVDLSASSHALILRADGNSVPTGLMPGEDLGAGTASTALGAVNNVQSGVLEFAVSRLAGSGIDNLQLGRDATLNSALPLTIAFSGDVNLSLPGRLSLSATRYQALPAGASDIPTTADVDTGATKVQLSAATVNFGGNSYNGVAQVSATPIAGNGSLSVRGASAIDLSGTTALAGFANASFSTDGDLRFLTPSNQTRAGNAAPIPGLLLTSGNLDFSAARIYPASSDRYILAAIGSTDSETTIRFEQAAGISNPGSPLSAGGVLLIDATHIEQAGSLIAPSGLIQFGVGNPADALAQALFAGAPLSDNAVLPLVATESVVLEAGSTTSVASNGLVVPYGFTVDGLQLQYDATHDPFRSPSANALGAPPSKQIFFNAKDVQLDGGLIDLAGGGDLRGQEFVPGTGGTRDVLAQSSATAGQTVYAILPGFNAPLGAYDPAFDTAGSGPLVGQSVHLSAVGNLPEGDYVLLPARYAVLDGAYRVVQNTRVQDALAQRNAVLPDGSYLSAGRYVDSNARLDGSVAQDARSTSFLVQSSSVWQQYSQYTLTSANSYFTDAATQAGTVTAALPLDAGQLVLAATETLKFGSSFSSAGGIDGDRHGLGARIDIAGQDIQILGAGKDALEGYVQLDAASLNSIGSASLLIGGTRSRTTAGDAITTTANSVVLSNDQASALSVPELILVTRTDPNAGTATADTVAQSTGVRLDAGSAILLSADAFPADRDVPITVSGDGTLLRASNGAPVSVTRTNTTGAVATLELGADVIIDRLQPPPPKDPPPVPPVPLVIQALTLDSSANLTADPTAQFRARFIDANASAISFISATTNAKPTDPGFVIGADGLAQLAASERVSLRSSGLISFFGAVSINLPTSLSLSLTASGFSGDGSDVSIHAGNLSLGGTAMKAGPVAGAAVPSAEVSLALSADTLTLAAGNTVFQGFGSIDLGATRQVLGTGTSIFDFGSSAVTVTTPLFAVDTGAQTSLTGTGDLKLTSLAAPTPPATASGIGGTLTIKAAALDIDARLAAPAGVIRLTTTGGDLVLGNNATLSVAGVAKTFYDVQRYAAGGAIQLDSGGGALTIGNGSTLDFSGAASGGDAGSLSITTGNAASTIGSIGHLQGGAASGYEGGSFELDTQGAADLDLLSEALTAGKVSQSISVHTHNGNLDLSTGNTLRAADVSLIADVADGAVSATAGNIVISGTIDASGVKGGNISLIGRSGVDIENSLIATGSSATERGGNVRIETSGVADSDPNTVYGYESVSAASSGTIKFGSKSVIDLRGGKAGGLENGTLSLRAPLLSDGGLNLQGLGDAMISGARSIDVEAYAVWSTADTSTGAQHFSGTIDPAAERNNPGFYSRTLANFVSQAPFAFEGGLAGIENLHVRPGIELRSEVALNPDGTSSDGNITVSTIWNLGAATLDSNGNVASYVYRHHGEAPVLTLRAENNLKIEASLTDGFVQFSNPLGLQAARLTTKATADNLYNIFVAAYPALRDSIEAPASNFPASPTPEQAAEIAQYYGLYEQYLNYLLYSREPVGQLESRPDTGQAPATVIEGRGVATLGLGAPQRPLDAQGYANYIVQYAAYFEQQRDRTVLPGRIALLQAPRALLSPVFTSATLVADGAVDNGVSPDNNPVGNNPFALASASLVGGPSSSYRLVAGADFGSADVEALQALPAKQDEPASGDITIDRHTTYTDTFTHNVIQLGTLVRTGTGSITLAAAHDFKLIDNTAPGAVYTAGAPTAGRYAGTDSSLFQPAAYEGNNPNPVPAQSGELVVSGVVQPDAAGNIRLHAENDIVGVEAAFTNDSNAGQFWWEWQQTGNQYEYFLDNAHRLQNGLPLGAITRATATSINYGAFGQGLLSAGGDVDVSAGGSIKRLSVSLPTTWYLNGPAGHETGVTYVGGGDLRVSAGADILSGSYFVAKGDGRIRAGGSIGSADLNFMQRDVDTVLALQDAQIDVAARGSVALGGIYNPSYLPPGLVASALFSIDSQPYSATASVAVTSTVGNLRLGTLSISDERAFFGLGGGNFTTIVRTDVLPSSLSLTALDGALSIEKAGELFPSPVGNLELVADGAISLASNENITVIGNVLDPLVIQDRYFGMIDADPASLPSPLSQLNAASVGLPLNLAQRYRYIDSSSNTLFHATTALHANDYESVRVYSLNGDIVGGRIASDGLLENALVLAPDKAALVYAGQDIVNLSFQGQHVHDSDITRIVAGRDIYDTAAGIRELVQTLQGSEPSLVLGGPGSFDVEAGRNIGPLTNQTDLANARLTAFRNGSIPIGTAPITGIDTVGNLYNPYLPRSGASLLLSFGVGPGSAQDAFINRYINPATVNLFFDPQTQVNEPDPTNLPSFDAELIAFVQAYQHGLAVNTGYVKDVTPLPPALDVNAAYTAFRALPEATQKQFVTQVLFDILRITGTDYVNPDSPYSKQYLRGYRAIATLFPGTRGYTQNNLPGYASNGDPLPPDAEIASSANGLTEVRSAPLAAGGGTVTNPDNVTALPNLANGALTTVSTGNLDLRGTTVQTQQGGSISVLGPGGQALIGSTSAPPVTRDAFGNTFAGPGTQGVLTLGRGDINIFTDRSLLLAQSRVFTELGGDIVIWSSNDDINAGRGQRTTSDTPAPSYICNPDFYCTLDARGAVTGAGIATLRTVADVEPGDVFLIAPSGTVDAGDAGIRVSGNLIVAAQAIANADNVQVQGSSVGLKLIAIDSGTLSAGSQAAAAAQQQAANLANRPVDRASTVITVEVYGFGTPDEQQKKRLRGGSN